MSDGSGNTPPMEEVSSEDNKGVVKGGPRRTRQIKESLLYKAIEKVKEQESSKSPAPSRDSSSLRNAQKHNYMDEFDGEWSGGKKNIAKNAPKDSYYP